MARVWAAVQGRMPPPSTEKPYEPERFRSILLKTRKLPVGVGFDGSPIAVAVTSSGRSPSITYTARFASETFTRTLFGLAGL